MKRFATLAFVVLLFCVAAPSLASQSCPYQTYETAVYEEEGSCTLCWGEYCWSGSLQEGQYVLVNVWWEDCPLDE